MMSLGQGYFSQLYFKNLCCSLFFLRYKYRMKQIHAYKNAQEIFI